MDRHWTALNEGFAELVELEPGERARRLERLARTSPELAVRLRALLDADHRLEPLPELESDAAGPDRGDRGDDDPRPARPAPDPLGFAGTVVSHFRVLDVLGGGGMGVVYRAEDVRLGRSVALKFLLPQYSADASAKRRFEQEARAVSALDHPNVCTVHEVGEDADGRLFIAMACYAGETLRDRLAHEGRLPLEEAVSVGRQLLLGLAAAHHAGIVHRDLKPANVQLVPGGGVKIMDFGLAKVRELGLTAPELRPGTAAYMSPEQLRGEPLDGRSDLWSFGVVLHEMLTGRPPFGGGHDLATLYSILYEQPLPPSSMRPDVPEALDALVARLLSKKSSARFATAEETLAELGAAVGANAGPMSGRRTGRRTRRRVLLGAVAILAAGGAAAAVGAWFGWPGRFAPSAGQPPVQPAPTASPANALASVAVLPFVDLSPEGDQEYFADGITEELLTALANVPGLRVPARTSSFYFKGKDLPVGEVARRLGVATVLEGSVRRAGDSVRITVQLVDARADRRLWTRTFDRDVRDVFAIQTEIARATAEALQVRLAAGQARGGATLSGSLAAHDLYLRGLFHWNRRTATDLAHAIRFFEEATRIDPAYARAYSGLALAHAVLRATGAGTSPEAAIQAVEAAASRALALDPSLAEAHAARAYVYHWTWRWDDAEREFRRALALSPGYATAHQWYGEHLVKMGRSVEGEAELRQAVALDPLSLVANNDLGLGLGLSRRYAEAIAQLERTHRMDPGFPIPLLLLHKFHLFAGDADAAAQAGRRWAELSGMVDPGELVTLARAPSDPGLRAPALAVLAEWERSPAPRWAELAFYYVLLDEKERAIAALERGLAARAPMMAQLRVAPWLDPLRDDPRFQRIVRAMGFPRIDDR